MISLCPFSDADKPILQRKQYPAVDMDEIRTMITEWKSRSCQERYFEMFAVTDGEKIVGSVSLFAHSKSIASAGIEIWQDERRRGYASEGIKLILDKARHQGYRVIQNQVSADNLPSIALHEKPGFETDGYICRNARDRSVFLFTYCL